MESKLNSDIREALERLMDAYWSISGHNLPVQRPIYSEAILALFQSRLDSIEWPRKFRENPNPVHAYDFSENDAIRANNNAIEACQQAVKKAFGEIS